MRSQHQSKALLRRPEVERRTGLKRSTIYSRMKEGSFPQSVSLGRSVAWVAEEIDAWIEERIAQREVMAA